MLRLQKRPQRALVYLAGTCKKENDGRLMHGWKNWLVRDSLTQFLKMGGEATTKQQMPECPHRQKAGLHDSIGIL
jgi:hypothetical protein